MAQNAALWFNILVMLVLPLGVLVWLIVKKRRLVLPFLIGALTFLASQIWLRVPLLRWMQGKTWYIAFGMGHPALLSILLGLSAGIFEEGGRYIAMLLMRKHRGFDSAVTFGIGHGGMEAARLVSNSLYYLSHQMLLEGISPLAIASAGFERLCTIVVHVAWSVMVMRAVERKNPLWLLLAIGLHTAYDAPIGLFHLAGIGTLGIESYLFLFAAGMLAFLLFTRPKKQPVPVTEAAALASSSSSSASDSDKPEE